MKKQFLILILVASGILFFGSCKKEEGPISQNKEDITLKNTEAKIEYKYFKEINVIIPEYNIQALVKIGTVKESVLEWFNEESFGFFPVMENEPLSKAFERSIYYKEWLEREIYDGDIKEYDPILIEISYPVGCPWEPGFYIRDYGNTEAHMKPFLEGCHINFKWEKKPEGADFTLDLLVHVDNSVRLTLEYRELGTTFLTRYCFNELINRGNKIISLAKVDEVYYTIYSNMQSDFVIRPHSSF